MELFGDNFKTKEIRPLLQVIEEAVNLGKTTDCSAVDAGPFMWWRTNEFRFPHEANHSQCYLCCKGEEFSTAKDIVDVKCSQLCSCRKTSK